MPRCRRHRALEAVHLPAVEERVDDRDEVAADDRAGHARHAADHEHGDRQDDEVDAVRVDVEVARAEGRRTSGRRARRRRRRRSRRGSRRSPAPWRRGRRPTCRPTFSRRRAQPQPEPRLLEERTRSRSTISAQTSSETNVVVCGTPISVLVPRVIDVVCDVEDVVHDEDGERRDAGLRRRRAGRRAARAGRDHRREAAPRRASPRARSASPGRSRSLSQCGIVRNWNVFCLGRDRQQRREVGAHGDERDVAEREDARVAAEDLQRRARPSGSGTCAPRSPCR